MIDNFLSDVEVDHLLELGRDMDLHESTTGQEKRANKSTSRTSRNTWVDREQTSIVDTIYRRAADVIKIDEALLRWRHEEEDHISRKISSRSKICESLQLVHYDLHQQYTGWVFKIYNPRSFIIQLILVFFHNSAPRLRLSEN